MGARPWREAKYWMELRISPTSPWMLSCTACSAAWDWADPSPSRSLMPSASASGRSRAAAMAAVASLPPVPMVRTNWGRPS